MEEENLFLLNRGDDAVKRVQSPFEGMICPSRRATNLSPVTNFRYPGTSGAVDVAGKTDYAANGGFMGDTQQTASRWHVEMSFPSSEAAAENFSWPDTGFFNGIVFQRSEINMRHVTDGTSNTYMVGEKWMSQANYDTGLDSGDNEPASSSWTIPA
jgi:hypothetical protein